MPVQTYDIAALVPKSLYASQARDVLGVARQTIAELPESFSRLEVDAALRMVGRSKEVAPEAIFSMLRVALAWPAATPDLFETMERLGRKETLARIDTALLRLGDVA